MLSSVEQAFVGREEIRAPLKTPAWEAKASRDISKIKSFGNGISRCFQEVLSTTNAMLFCLHPRLGTMSLKCPRPSTTSHGLNVSQI